MNQPQLIKLKWFELTQENGSQFVRMGERNWAEWMGESLEIVQSADENAILEAQFRSMPAYEKETPKIVHGVNCPKFPHGGMSGFLHSENDDTPYMVDGVRYCGRCHEWI